MTDEEAFGYDEGDPRFGIDRALQALYQKRDQLAELVREVEDDVRRHENALRVLNGEPIQQRGSKTTGIAIIAALNSFPGPVHTSALLDHDDLVHYSRNALRAALGELKRQGKLTPVERTPHGYIWAPNGKPT
jgi:hypothetical protein